MRHKRVVLFYPFKFNGHIWRLLELGLYSKYVDVKVYDVSSVANPGIGNVGQNGQCTNQQVVVLSGFYYLIKELYVLKKEGLVGEIFVFDEIIPRNIRELVVKSLIFLFLKRAGGGVVNLHLGSLPVFVKVNDSSSFFGYFCKLINGIVARLLLINRPVEFFKLVERGVVRSLSRLKFFSPDYSVVGSSDLMKILQAQEIKRTHLVYAHSSDYSQSLIKCEEIRELRDKYVVFLAPAGPVSVGDAQYFGKKEAYTKDVWCPQMTTFFKKIENEMGVKVVVAGHYKTDKKSYELCYLGNKVFHGITCGLVKNCEFVITVHSAAISFAVIHEKPILFTYSNQLIKDKSTMDHMESLAKVLSAGIVNIDNFSVEKIKKAIRCDRNKYEIYKKRALTLSGIQQCNSDIVLRDVIGVDVAK